jgi:hypothetical protein
VRHEQWLAILPKIARSLNWPIASGNLKNPPDAVDPGTDGDRAPKVSRQTEHGEIDSV